MRHEPCSWEKIKVSMQPQGDCTWVKNSWWQRTNERNTLCVGVCISLRLLCELSYCRWVKGSCVTSIKCYSFRSRRYWLGTAQFYLCPALLPVMGQGDLDSHVSWLPSGLSQRSQGWEIRWLWKERRQAITPPLPVATSPLKVCFLRGSGSYYMTYTTFPAPAEWPNPTTFHCHPSLIGVADFYYC